MRSLLVGLLSHQLLLQTISSVLLSANEASTSTLTIETDGEPGVEPETVLPGLLSYLSPANLSVLFDCLMESHTVAYEFNARPGLRSLIQKLTKLDHPANLLRQSTTAFTCYLHTLFQICKHSGEHFSSSHIKRILTGDRVNGNNGHAHTSTHAHAHAHAHAHDNEYSKEEVLGSPSRHNDLLKGSGSVEWIVRRLHEACDQLSSVYIRMYNTYTNDNQFNYNITTTEFDLDRSLSWTPMSSPARDNPPRAYMNGDERPSSPNTWKYGSPDHKKEKNGRENRKHNLEEDLRMIELERQLLRRKEDELLQLGIWTNLVILMLEALLGLPTLQFKAVLPAVFPAVTGLITTGTDPKVRQLVCDVVRRIGAIYGIL